MAKKSNTSITKKIFFMYVSEDIDHPIRWSVKNDFKSLIQLKSYKTAGALYKALQEEECHFLILDSVLFESVGEFIAKVYAAVPTIMILVVTQAEAPGRELKELTSMEGVADAIMRPFTPDQLNKCLYEIFGFKKPVELNLFNVKKGMVLAADVFSATSKDPIVNAGVVLDDEDIDKMINCNIQRVSVHDETARFLNCWEVKKCGHEGRCPASVFLDADGFLGGINAGRGCMFVKDTLLEIEKHKDKPFGTKIRALCSKCEYCKLVATESRGKVSHADFIEYVKSNKGKKTKSAMAIFTDEKPKVN